jgi:ABC-type branched-subunit amino acid transport system ATPase component
MPVMGPTLMVGSPADVRASEAVRDAYLGKADVA